METASFYQEPALTDLHQADLGRSAPTPAGLNKECVPYGRNEPLRSTAGFNPNQVFLDDINTVFDSINSRLFDNKLRIPMFILQKLRKNTYGHFARDRFCRRDKSDTVDEIALNPSYFAGQTDQEILATIGHESVHGWQADNGMPGKRGYHNRQWAKKMIEIGLMPSSTGMPGGRKTGYSVADYIIPDGPFERFCADLLATGFSFSFVDRRTIPSSDDGAAGVLEDGAEVGLEDDLRGKAKLKTAFICNACAAKAWAKRSIQIDCRPCRQPMIAQPV